MSFKNHVTYELKKDVLHMSYGRTCYIWVTEGHVTNELQKDMLHMSYGRTCYKWVTEGHVTYELRKDMLHMSYGRTCYKWVMEGHVTYELNIEVWLIVDVTCPSVTFMYRYGRTNDDSLTNKAFISIDISIY